MDLVELEQLLVYRDIQFTCLYTYWLDPDTGEEFETEAQYEANYARIQEAYQTAKSNHATSKRLAS